MSKHIPFPTKAICSNINSHQLSQTTIVTHQQNTSSVNLHHRLLKPQITVQRKNNPGRQLKPCCALQVKSHCRPNLSGTPNTNTEPQHLPIPHPILKTPCTLPHSNPKAIHKHPHSVHHLNESVLRNPKQESNAYLHQKLNYNACREQNIALTLPTTHPSNRSNLRDSHKQRSNTLHYKLKVTNLSERDCHPQKVCTGSILPSQTAQHKRPKQSPTNRNRKPNNKSVGSIIKHYTARISKAALSKSSSTDTSISSHKYIYHNNQVTGNKRIVIIIQSPKVSNQTQATQTNSAHKSTRKQSTQQSASFPHSQHLCKAQAVTKHNKLIQGYQKSLTKKQ
eukprot:gene3547-2498_t